MGTDTAELLYTIAGNRAASGYAWESLNAHVAADALAIGAELEKTSTAMLDIGPLRTLALEDSSLPGAVRACRAMMLKGLDSWGIAGTVGAALPAITVADINLDPAAAGSFAATRLNGCSADEYAAAEAGRAGRFAALAARLYQAGDAAAANRSARAACAAVFTAHHASEAAAAGDTGLAALQTGELVAAELLGRRSPDTAAGIRAAYDAANLTGVDIHWEPVSFLF